MTILKSLFLSFFITFSFQVAHAVCGTVCVDGGSCTRTCTGGVTPDDIRELGYSSAQEYIFGEASSLMGSSAEGAATLGGISVAEPEPPVNFYINYEQCNGQSTEQAMVNDPSQLGQDTRSRLAAAAAQMMATMGLMYAGMEDYLYHNSVMNRFLMDHEIYGGMDVVHRATDFAMGDLEPENEYSHMAMSAAINDGYIDTSLFGRLTEISLEIADTVEDYHRQACQ